MREPVVEDIALQRTSLNLKEMVCKVFENEKMQIPKTLPRKSSYQPKHSTSGMCSEKHNWDLIIIKESYDHLDDAVIYLASSTSQ